MDDDHFEKVLAVIRQNRCLTVREVAYEVGICKSSCHVILTDKLQMRRVAAKFLPHLLTGAQKQNRVTVSQELFDRSTAALLPRFGPCGLFIVPEVEILTKRSSISEGRGDRRKFDTGPLRHPAKHVPGRIPELEKNIGRGVSRAEGSTLKETNLIKLYVKQQIKNKKSSVSLWTALVCSQNISIMQCVTESILMQYHYPRLCI